MAMTAVVPDPGARPAADPARAVRRSLDERGEWTGREGARPRGTAEQWLDLYSRMVVGRRFDQQATALSKQGRLAVYPSSEGQEACQVAAAAVLRPTDWLFPTYRDSVAVMSRGIDPVAVLTLMRGDWHCGYDPLAHRTAPQATPLATQALHAVGLAQAARMAGDDVVALALVGDGATSEGDFHEACNFAAVHHAPVVFLVQNNQYAISVPLSRQTAAERIADRAVGYGMSGCVVDGNDVLAVSEVLSEAVEAARAGAGPCLVEALTYRVAAHTNADDDSRYRDPAEVAKWRERDPVVRLERYLRAEGVLDDERAVRIAADAERLAAQLRERVAEPPAVDPAEMFTHVYTGMTPRLRDQARAVRARRAEAHDRNGVTG